jgi:hypothetical protein
MSSCGSLTWHSYLYFLEHFLQCGVIGKQLFVVVVIAQDEKSKITQVELGAEAHAYNLSYLGGQDWEYQNSRPAWEKLARLYLNQ